jgi:hypothetical protein
MPYLIGNAVTISTAIAAGTPPVATDPSTITLTVTKPDNTVDTFTSGQLTHTGTGAYTYVYLPATAGGYRYVWTTTSPASASDGTFYVENASSTLVTLADVRAELNLTDNTEDVELLRLIETAGQIIQFDPDNGVGPVVPTTYTESLDGGDHVIYTRHAPVLSVTSLQEFYGSQSWTLTLQPYGSSVDAYGYSIDDPYMGRIVRRTINGSLYTFPPGTGNIIITYIAGQANVPANIRKGVLELVRFMYRTQQGGGNPRNIDDFGPGFLMPNRVIEALRPSKRPPAIA